MNTLSTDKNKWKTLINDSNIVDERDNNHIILCFDTASGAEVLLTSKGLNALVMGSIVTKCFGEPNAIVADIPAKEVKT